MEKVKGSFLQRVFLEKQSNNWVSPIEPKCSLRNLLVRFRDGLSAGTNRSVSSPKPSNDP